MNNNMPQTRNIEEMLTNIKFTKTESWRSKKISVTSKETELII